MTQKRTLRCEYIILLDRNIIRAMFQMLHNVTRFNEFLRNEIRADIRDKEIVYKGNAYAYKIRAGNVPNKDQRYFHLSIDCDNDKLKEYNELLFTIRRSCDEQSFVVETLQDDLSFYYSSRAYELIHEIENLMRKFITFFMIANVGREWVDDGAPKIVKEALDKSRRTEYSSVLQKLDFKHLGDFMFSRYQSSDNDKLYKMIDACSNESDIDLTTLKSFVPKSNWDKFFGKVIGVEESYLKNRWEKLYDLRNIVAHTSSLSRNKFNEIVQITSEVKKTISDVFDNLNKVKIDNADRKFISERIVTAIDDKAAGSLKNLKSIEHQIRSEYPQHENTDFSELIDILIDGEEINEETGNKIKSLIELKDKMIFGSNLSDDNVAKIAFELGNLDEQIQNTWSKDVYFALDSLGGKASLENIYQKISENPQRKLFGSWRTSVRRALYIHSSDVELYDGRYDIYKKIGKGRWMIRHDINPDDLKSFLGEESAKS